MVRRDVALLAIAACACAESHSPTLAADSSVAMLDASVPDAPSDDNAGEPECVSGEAMLTGRSPFGDASELRFVRAKVADCSHWDGTTEVVLSFSAEREPGFIGTLWVSTRIEAGLVFDTSGYGGGTSEAVFGWVGDPMDLRMADGTITIAGADPAREGELGWIHGTVGTSGSEIELEGSFRATYCDIEVCL